MCIMNTGDLIDNKFSVLNIIDKKGTIYLINSTYKFEFYRVLFFENSKENASAFRNYPFYIIFFNKAVHHGKTKDYVYFAFSYDSPLTIDSYLSCIPGYSGNYAKKTPSTPSRAKNTGSNMSFDELVSKIKEERKRSQTDQMNHHYMFAGKDMGFVKKMTGKILIMNIFTDEAFSFWTNAAEKEYHLAFSRAIELLKSEAARYGARMDIDAINHHVSTSQPITRHNDAMISPSVHNAINIIGKKSIIDYQNSYKKEFGADEVPVVIALNKSARSCAFTANTYCANSPEFCLAARNRYGGRFSHITIAHELVHLFGAKDFYFPEIVALQSIKHFPNSIMNGGEKVDPLTAYLIGWVDELPEEAVCFMETIKHITYDDYIAALKKENSMKNE